MAIHNLNSPKDYLTDRVEAFREEVAGIVSADCPQDDCEVCNRKIHSIMNIVKQSMEVGKEEGFKKGVEAERMLKSMEKEITEDPLFSALRTTKCPECGVQFSPMGQLHLSTCKSLSPKL